MSWSIYIIQNRENGKTYVGQTKNVKKRFGGHRYALKTNIHHNPQIQQDFNSCGLDIFTFKVVEENIPTKKLANDAEDVWMKKFDFSYNVIGRDTARNWPQSKINYFWKEQFLNRFSQQDIENFKKALTELESPKNVSKLARHYGIHAGTLRDFHRGEKLYFLE